MLSKATLVSFLAGSVAAGAIPHKISIVTREVETPTATVDQKNTETPTATVTLEERGYYVSINSTSKHRWLLTCEVVEHAMHNFDLDLGALSSPSREY